MGARIPEDHPEVKKDLTACMTDMSTPDPIKEMIERFLSWDRLKKTVAWMLRYKSNLHCLSEKRRTQETVVLQSTSEVVPITVAELFNAEIEIVKHVQSQYFKEELNCLTQLDQRANSSSQEKAVKKSSSIFKLDPKLTQGLIRVGDRLQRTPINTDAMHPVILPKKQHVVKLITKHYHHLSGHSGLEHALSLIRQRYWIISARPTVRSLLNDCFSCRKCQAPKA